FQIPLRHRAPKRGYLLGYLAIGAAADHVMGAGREYIEDGRAVHGDAERGEITRNEPGAEASGFERVFGLALVEIGEEAPGRIAPPMRRHKALHTPAFLVDEDERHVRADRLAEVGDQRADLVRALAIALEQDEAAGRGVAEEALLVCAEA